MNRNGDYIINKIIDSAGYAKKAQVGVDLSLDRVERMTSGATLKANSKVDLPTYEEVIPEVIDDAEYFVLEPGVYIIEFDQGLKKLDANEWGFIVQRSSLNRCGVRISSSIWDPGFETDKMGTTLIVSNPIKIARHARIGQMLIFENDPVDSDNLYSGRWQGLANHS